MRRYSVDIKGKTYVIDVQETARDRFQVRVQDQEFEVALTSAQDVAEATITPGIAPDDTPAPAAAAMPRSTAKPAAQTYKPPAPETLPAVPEISPPPLPATAQPAPDVITTPMPGTVLEVLVSQGDHVARGDTVVKLEAMKMINAIKAPRDGVVAEVLVQAGQQARYGAPLVRLAEQWVGVPQTNE